MTREEAVKKALSALAGEPIREGDINARQLINTLEALGLIKFDEPIAKLFEMDARGRRFGPQKDTDELNKFNNQFGVIRLEEWIPEGLVLWVGGQIVWKSWETYFTPTDLYNKHKASNNPSDDKCISIFGYNLSELAKIITKARKENSPGG